MLHVFHKEFNVESQSFQAHIDSDKHSILHIV